MKRMQIRDNSKMILGLTGLKGSGCSSVANMFAFDIIGKINNYLSSYDEKRISELLEELDKLKNIQKGDKSGVEVQKELEEVNKQLKDDLEKREQTTILKDFKYLIEKNKFFYVSFSAMIIYFVIKDIDTERCKDEEIKTILKNSIERIGFTLYEAKELVNKFYKNKDYKQYFSDKDKKKRLIELFSMFYKIKEDIVESKGAIILQDYSDKIRKYGSPFIDKQTKESRKLGGRWIAVIVDKYIKLNMSDYKYFVIECFKNPQELYYFRENYSFFYLIAINARKENRLKHNQLDDNVYNEIEKRELGEGGDHHIYSLNVSKCIDIADIIVQNDESLDELYSKLLRYLVLLFEPGCLKPRELETLMHTAYTLSVKSNCISRQVGAVITNKYGYIIGAGWNDVGEGQLSCGLKMGKDYSSKYLKNIDIKITEQEKDRYICVKNKFKKAIEKDGDYCPVLHAEENAILQLAKYNSGTIKDSVMYSTTYPCTTCLKKISQVGIKKVVFSESYINPLRRMYIDQNIYDIRIVPFEGVKSFSYFKLFKPYYDKKEQQLLIYKE